MIIVKLRAAHPDGDVEIAQMHVVPVGEVAQAGANDLSVLLGHRIRHVIRRRVRFFLENGKIPLQLVAQNIQQRRGRGGREGKGSDQKRDEAHEFLG
jgi:hypothetical protein